MSTHSPAGPRLSTFQKFAYGLADIPILFIIMPMSIWMSRFYTGDMGMAISTVANIILITGLLDVVTDPLMGYLSDKTKTRWGRRKPWIAASIPILMIGIYKVFMPPEGVGSLYLFGWLTVMWLGWTMLLIPYYAWAAELSDNYDERTSITRWRAAMGAVGQIMAQLIPLVALLAFNFGGPANVMWMLGVGGFCMVPICVGFSLATVGERPHAKSAVVPFFAGLRLMFRNGPFLRLVLAFSVAYIGLAISMPLYVFFVEFILERSPGDVVYMLAFATTSSLVGVPIWVAVSKRVGKHKAWIFGFGVVSLVSPMYLFLGAGDFWWMLPGIVLIGMSTASFQVLPNSMKADVIDLDTARSGENRAALFFSAWSLAQKLASRIGNWLALQMLALFGFSAANGADNTDDALLGLRLAFSMLPVVFYVLAGIIVWKYPITKERQERIRSAINRREARRNGTAPTLAE